MVDDAVTLGMAYGLAFGTPSIIFRVRIIKLQEAMDQFRFVWQFDVSVKAKTEKINALVWNKIRWSVLLSLLLPALRQKSMPPKTFTSAAYSNSPPPTSAGSPIKNYAVAAVLTVFSP